VEKKLQKELQYILSNFKQQKTKLFKRLQSFYKFANQIN